MAALSSTLKELHWTVVANDDSMRASRLDSEPSRRGVVHLQPQAASPPSDVWTDGSIKVDGAAAAVQLASQTQFLHAIKRPHSSTQCELVALSLVIKAPTQKKKGTHPDPPPPPLC